MPSVRRCVALTAALVVVLAAGCSRQPPPLQALPAPSVTRGFVPDLVGLRYDEADATLQAQLLVPIVRFAPELITNAGTVVSLEPPAGSVAKTGDVIVVIVAGKPPKSRGEGPPGARAIAELAKLEQQPIVGVGSDRDNTIVVSFAPGVDLASWQPRITALARGERFRLQSCKYSGPELRSLMAQLAERDFLPRAKQMQFSIVVDPVSCSVQLGGAFTSAEATQLRDRYGDALTVLTGKPTRT